MKKEYITPFVRPTALIPETLIALSTPNAHPGEDDEERAPQGSRGFDWEISNDNFWNE